MIIRGIIAGSALLILLAAVVLVINLTGKENSKAEEPQQTLAAADVLTVPHLSFDTLVVNAEAAGSDGMTVEEFNEILQLLYDNDYILVSVRDLANVTEQKDDSVTIAAKDLELPEGKKPLVLSQNDVSYPLTLRRRLRIQTACGRIRKSGIRIPSARRDDRHRGIRCHLLPGSISGRTSRLLLAGSQRNHRRDRSKRHPRIPHG